MLEHAKQLDKMVLLSGDGDFALLLGHLANKYQLPCDVYGAEYLTADILKQSAAEFHCIDDSLLLSRWKNIPIKIKCLTKVLFQLS